MPRWIRIRQANIDPELRETFEHYGLVTLQVLLSSPENFIRHQGNIQRVQKMDKDLLPWLTEQYDRAERKETWSITMEVAITIFVGIEVLPSIIRFIRCIL